VRALCAKNRQCCSLACRPGPCHVVGESHASYPMAMFSIYFVKTKVPETKGLSLEEIEQQFTNMYQQNAGYIATSVLPLLDSDIT